MEEDKQILFALIGVGVFCAILIILGFIFVPQMVAEAAFKKDIADIGWAMILIWQIK